MKTLEAILNGTNWTMVEIGIPDETVEGGWTDIPVTDLSQISGRVEFESDNLIVVIAEDGSRIEMYKRRPAT